MKRMVFNRMLARMAMASAVMALVWGSAVFSAQAAPLDPADIASGAKWFVHIDFDAARVSKVGERIHAEALKNEHVKKELAKLQDEIGMDPQKDLHGATLYGTTFAPHTGVLIVYATADKAKLMAHLKTKPDFIALKTVDGEHELYTWTEHMGHKPMDGKKSGTESKRPTPKGHAAGGHAAMRHGFMAGEHKHTVWAAFPKHGVGVFADSAADLKAALDVLGGKGGMTSSSSLLPDAPKGTVFSGAVSGLTGAHIPARMPLAKQIEGISFAGGESDGEDFDHIKVTLTGADVAKQLKTIIDGFQALASLQLAGHPEALKLVSGLKVEADGKVLSIDWKASSDDVIKFGEKACEFIKQHHGEWHHGDGKAVKKAS